MIRSHSIRGRLGALEISQGCIEYQDPTTGLWVSDPNSPCPPAGAGTGSSLPADPGAAQALADFAAGNAAASNSAALNQLGIPFFGSTSTTGALIPSAASLTPASGLPSPIPGLGLGPNLQTWWIWAIVAAGLLILFAEPPAQQRRRR